MQSPKIKIALVDDHTLMRKSLAGLIDSFNDYEVVLQADSGPGLFEKLRRGGSPDLVLLDIQIPEMDGLEIALQLREHHSSMKILALSMHASELVIMRAIHNGAKGYILKDCEPEELERALGAVASGGTYYPEKLSGRRIHAARGEHIPISTEVSVPNEREMEFLKNLCAGLGYKEIAEKMTLSPRTIEGYRDALFEKLEVRSRVGLVIYAIKNGLVKI